MGKKCSLSKNKINQLQRAGNRVQHKLCAVNNDCIVTVLGQNSVLLSNLTPQKYHRIVEWLNILLNVIGVIMMRSTEDLL